MAGLNVNRNVINGRAGNLVLQLRQLFADARRMKAWFDATPDDDLIEMGFSSEEVAMLKSAFTDLDKLAKVATAEDTQSLANDFFFWANRLTGIQ